MAKKKAVIGCEDFKITVQEGNGVTQAGTLFPIPGLQEVGLELESEQGKIFADNETALILNSGVTGATVTGNFVELSSEERAELLGVSIEDGMEVYKKDLVPPYVSASWKYRCNDGSFIYMGATRGNFGLPSSSAATLEDGAPEHQDQVELEGTFIPREDGVVFVRVHDKSQDFSEQKFMELIHGVSTTEPLPEG
ncbi:major tail protein [Mammaliicoccus sciuri]|uniref:major tail protein n=1 Tax=Mammaliicoccus sciuri TaxID=1296 RepID=UPI00066DDA0B|nr:major tail protein [Mammaliicoccus sciuri]